MITSTSGRLRLLACSFLLLTGCAGNEATIWKQSAPSEERTAIYCVEQAGDRRCKSLSKSQMHRFLEEMARRQQGLT